MKKLITCLIFAFSILLTNCSSSQGYGCFSGKKVKLKKGKKKSPGALVGVKGTSDKKSQKAQEKERKKAIKERRAIAKRAQDSIDELSIDTPDLQEEEDKDDGEK
ncbi:hypothetical protein [Aquimarina agarivorans]|uniref:hypothetical protein n=1 Tax=Aquimarina agarivorans TaxID=980584 RepID=UPI000248EDC5|nr:hypothetical protein [Aquimarina agarivorans]